MKTSTLIGTALDWAVAKAEGTERSIYFGSQSWEWWHPSTDWAQGGLIIEREWITVGYDQTHAVGNQGFAYIKDTSGGYKEMRLGPTHLIAAMRCYVASMLGDDVNVPEELQ